MTVIESTTIKDETVPGLEWRVTVHPDEDAGRPEDNGDCYTPSQIKAWQNDQWSYVGVMVTPVVSGMLIDEAAQSLWAVEYGWFLLTDEQDNEQGWIMIGLNSFVNGEGDKHEAYPVPDLIAESRAALAKILPALAEKYRAAAALIAVAEAARKQS